MRGLDILLARLSILGLEPCPIGQKGCQSKRGGGWTGAGIGAGDRQATGQKRGCAQDVNHWGTCQVCPDIPVGLGRAELLLNIGQVHVRVPNDCIQSAKK